MNNDNLNQPSYLQTPVPPVIPESEKKNFLSLISVIITAVVVFAAGGYFIYQYYFAPEETEEPIVEELIDETVGWQTYRNEEWGIEFNYPKGWVVSIKESEDFPQYFSVETNKDQIKENPKFVVSINPESWFFKPYLETISTENISIGDYLFIKTSFQAGEDSALGCGNSGIKGFQLSLESAEDRKEKDTRVWVSVCDDDVGELEILDSIFSSLNLFEPIIDTSDWQTYRDEEYGFEVKYPEDWQEQKSTSDTFELTTEYLPKGGDSAQAFSDRLFIKVKDNKEELSLKELVDLNKLNFNYIYGIEKYKQIDGRESFEGRVDNMGMSTLYEVLVVIADDKILDVSFEYFYKESLARFTQILSTFKFIE